MDRYLEKKSIEHFPFTYGDEVENKRKVLQQEVKRAWEEQNRSVNLSQSRSLMN